MSNPPSRFLKEIPQDVLDLRRAPGLFQKSKRHSMLMGAVVSHPTYGNGIVGDVDTSSGTIKVSVDFTEFGLSTGSILSTKVEIMVLVAFLPALLPRIPSRAIMTLASS